jgi:hypothetical protein
MAGRVRWRRWWRLDKQLNWWGRGRNLVKMSTKRARNRVGDFTRKRNKGLAPPGPGQEERQHKK